MSAGQRESIALDAGVLVEFTRGSKRATDLRRRMEAQELLPVVSELSLAEMSYVVCRKDGATKAERAAALVRESGFFRVLPDSQFLEGAARLKCERSISFADCISIAVGEGLSIPVLFAGRERELERELSKKPFRVQVRFLSDRQV